MTNPNSGTETGNGNGGINGNGREVVIRIVLPTTFLVTHGILAACAVLLTGWVLSR